LTMAGMFIDVQVDAAVAADPALAKKLVEVCPVNIFRTAKSGALEVIGQNLDECTLCDLCIKAAPAGTARGIKLYEEERRGPPVRPPPQKNPLPTPPRGGAAPSLSAPPGGAAHPPPRAPRRAGAAAKSGGTPT